MARCKDEEALAAPPVPLRSEVLPEEASAPIEKHPLASTKSSRILLGCRRMAGRFITDCY